jgi:anti-sigma-K factor RskA
MTTREHDPFIDDVGAYLLGALDPGEERAFEEHLETCGACRQEVLRLEMARDALPRAVDQVAPPESLKASLMATVRAEAASGPEPAPEAESAAVAPATARGRSRRRSRWRELLLTRPQFAAAAAALLLAVGIGLGALIGAVGGGDDSTTVAATVDQSRLPGAQASLELQEEGGSGGAILRVEGMQQPAPNQVYEVWVKRGDEVKPSSLFTVALDGSGAAAIPDDLDGADAVMVTREPRAGSITPSEEPVVTVPLPS